MHLSPSLVFKIPIYWTFFWNAIYVLSPPREYFHSPGYNRYLDIVSYYGGLNIRSLVMKAYGAPPSDAPPPPKRDDSPKA